MKKFIDLKGDFNPNKKNLILDTFNSILENNDNLQLDERIKGKNFFSLFFEGSNTVNTLHLYVKDDKDSTTIGETYSFPLNELIEFFSAPKEDCARRTIELIREA